MNPCSEDIKDILVSESALGLTFGTNLFIGMLPDMPKDVVALIDTGGPSPSLTLDKQVYHYDVLQVVCRNTDYLTGYNIMQDIMVQLHGRASETWNGTLYTVIICASAPGLVLYDDNNCVVFSSYFNIQRR